MMPSSEDLNNIAYQVGYRLRTTFGWDMTVTHSRGVGSDEVLVFFHLRVRGLAEPVEVAFEQSEIDRIQTLTDLAYSHLRDDLLALLATTPHSNGDAGRIAGESPSTYICRVLGARPNSSVSPLPPPHLRTLNISFADALSMLRDSVELNLKQRGYCDIEVDVNILHVKIKYRHNGGVVQHIRTDPEGLRVLLSLLIQQGPRNPSSVVTGETDTRMVEL